MYEARFRSRLFRVPGKGGWTFATVPPRFAPSRTLGWGRVPVLATVDGHQWKTSIWPERSGRTLLPVPRKVCGRKGPGDQVTVHLTVYAA